MKDCVSFAFLMSWALVILYLWSRFCIFNRPILEEYVSQVWGGGGTTYFNNAYMQREITLLFKK